MGTVSMRYIVDDVDAAIAFYSDLLGFSVEMHPAPGFAILSRGELRLLLNAPGGPGGAARPMPDGRMPEPGGWNRIQLEVSDLVGEVKRLREAGAHFRNDIVAGRVASKSCSTTPRAIRSSCSKPLVRQEAGRRPLAVGQVALHHGARPVHAAPIRADRTAVVV